MGELRLRLFGAVAAWHQDRPLTFDTRKAFALLAYLAVTGRAHRREHLAALLWPTSESARARAALRRTVSVAGTVGPALQVSRSEIGLAPELTSCDVVEFEKLASARDPESLLRAAELAPDDFMAGFHVRDSPEFDDWMLSTSERLRTLRAATLGRLSELERKAGRTQAALEFAAVWSQLDPLSEVAHRELMVLHTLVGERAAALRQYRTCVRILDNELGVAPLPETTALYEDIRANRVPQLHPGSRAHPAVAAQAVHSPGFVGRDSELAALMHLWRRAETSGATAVVVGPSGIGRTTLLRQLSARVEDEGGVTLWVRGHAAESDLAMAGLDDVVRALAEISGTRVPARGPLDGPGDVVRLYGAIRAALREAIGGPRRGLLVIDDSQWWDPTSLDLLGYLLRRPIDGMLIVAAVTGDVSQAQPAFDPDAVVTVPPWNPSDVAAALIDRGQEVLDPQEVYRRTGGVPRLVIEYAIAADAEGVQPDARLRDLVSARLHAAPPATRQLLGAAAVIGATADPSLLRSTSGRDDVEVVEAIEDAVGRGLLVEDRSRTGYDVPYDALRDLILQDMSLARRRLLHGRAADAHRRRHRSGDRPVTAVIARHLVEAGRQQEAAEWYWEAAQDAARLYSHREALQHLQSARALGHRPDQVHLASGDALVRLGRYTEAVLEYEQAAASMDGTSASLPLVEYRIAEVHDRLGDWPLAEAHLERALEHLGAAGTEALHARVMADLALVLHRQNCSEATTTISLAADLASESGDDAARAHTANIAGVIAVATGRHSEAEHLLRASRVHAKSAKSHELEVAALNNLARFYVDQGQLDLALPAAESALDLGVRHGDLHRVAALHNHLADILHRLGREDEAMVHLKEAATAFAEVDHGPQRPEVWKLVTW